MMPHLNPKEIEKHLKGINYPVKKDDLVNTARKEGASEQVIEALEHLPQETFQKPTDVTRALGQEERGER